MLWYWKHAQDASVGELDAIFWLGVAARVLLVATPIFTTHDVERYLWDGAVLIHGFDPYLFHPDHPALSDLRAVWPTPEEHAAYPTLYPPLALALYGLCALAGPTIGIWLWKLLACGASIATLKVTDHLLTRHKKRHHLPLVALSPLMLLEVGVGAHVDIFATLAIIAAICAITERRWLRVGFAIGLGTSIKLLPVVMLLPVAATLSPRLWPKVGLGFIAACALCYGLALAVGLLPLGSLGVFFEKWRFGSPIFTAIEASPLEAKLTWVILAIGLGGLGLVWYQARRDLYTAIIIMLSLPLILSPVSFPWYLMVLVPLSALRPNLILLVWLTAVPLTYEVLNGFIGQGVWQPAVWPLWVIGLGWLLSIGVTLSPRLRYSLYGDKHPKFE